MSLGSLFILSGCSVFGIRTGTPEVPYTIIDKVSDVQIRSYNSRLVAEVVDAKDSKEAFYLLFDYISGDNFAKQSISMTAPVEVNKSSQSIKMTAPVQVESGTSGKIKMRFFLPSDFTIINTPAPKNPRVKIVELPPELFAAVSYTGVSSDEDIEEMSQKIKTILTNTKWECTGTPLYYGYDPPFTIPFLRRNEVLLKVKSLT